jgi:LysR family transcriptional regulator, chromosome initiation inhibitor
MPLDPRQLDAFAATIDSGSLSAAARGLRITLAATSLRIKALEDALGQRVLVRGKVARATPAGQALLSHIKQVRLLEADLAHTLQPARHATEGQHTSISVAVNADSLASWFFPGVLAALQRHRLTLDVVVDDQDHTLEWLKNGDVVGCVTTLSVALRGCVAEPLGTMRYRCVAAPAVQARLVGGTKKQMGIGLHQLVKEPAIVFNRKDSLQDQFLQTCFGLADLAYPRHYIPAVDAYHDALVNGLGWGMEADIQSAPFLANGTLVDLFPSQFVDVPLYWQHWQREAPQAARLTLAIKAAAKQYLLETTPTQQASGLIAA